MQNPTRFSKGETLPATMGRQAMKVDREARTPPLLLAIVSIPLGAAMGDKAPTEVSTEMSKGNHILHLALFDTNLRQRIPPGLGVLLKHFAKNWRPRNLKWSLSTLRW